MARPELGLKRQCMSCGAKFYDLDRSPAVCPKCGTTYQAAAGGRIAAPALAAKPDEDDEEIDEKAGPEIVSLDEVEASEEGADNSNDDDADSDSESSNDSDDTFLEEDDSDDDVADLIDGDVENDEET